MKVFYKFVVFFDFLLLIVQFFIWQLFFVVTTGSVEVEAVRFTVEKEKEKPAQGKCKKEIVNLNSQLVSLITLKNSGMSLVTEKEIKNVKNKLHEQEMVLKT